MIKLKAIIYNISRQMLYILLSCVLALCQNPEKNVIVKAMVYWLLVALRWTRQRVVKEVSERD